MKSAKRFRIVPFENPGGTRAYRVTGTLDGKTIRKNFKSKSEAVAYRQKMNVAFLNQESDGQTVWTTLTHDQNRDAIAATNLLRRSGSSKSLTFAVKYLLDHYHEAAETKTVGEASEEYMAARKKDFERGSITQRQERAIRMEIDKLVSIFDERKVGELRPDELRSYLDQPLGRSKAVPSLKTWNNRRGLLSTFFKFCLAGC